MYKEWKVGDQLDVYASLRCFCSPEDSFLLIGSSDIVLSGSSSDITKYTNCDQTASYCADYRGQNVVFSIFDGTTETILRTLGTGQTDQTGTAQVSFTVTPEYLEDYERIIKTSSSAFQIQIEILGDSDTISRISVSPAENVYSVEFAIRPFSFISLDYLVQVIGSRLPDLNALVLDSYQNDLDYNFISSEVLKDSSENVAIIKLNFTQKASSNVSVLAVPLLILAGHLLLALGIVILGAGIYLWSKDILKDKEYVSFEAKIETTKNLEKIVTAVTIEQKLGISYEEALVIDQKIRAETDPVKIRELLLSYGASEEDIEDIAFNYGVSAEAKAVSYDEIAKDSDITTLAEKEQFTEIADTAGIDVSECNALLEAGTLTPEEALICALLVSQDTDKASDPTLEDISERGEEEAGDLIQFALVAVGALLLVGYLSGKAD